MRLISVSSNVRMVLNSALYVCLIVSFNVRVVLNSALYVCLTMSSDVMMVLNSALYVRLIDLDRATIQEFVRKENIRFSYKTVRSKTELQNGEQFAS